MDTPQRPLRISADAFDHALCTAQIARPEDAGNPDPRRTMHQRLTIAGIAAQQRLTPWERAEAARRFDHLQPGRLERYRSN